MKRVELNKLMTLVGHLFYNNSFLSTSFDPAVAVTFAESDSSSSIVPVLIEIEIDTSLKADSPYACIYNSSEEKEFIISPGYPLRLRSIERDNTVPKERYVVKLKSDKSEDSENFLGDTFTLMIGAGLPVVVCSVFFFR
jgi:hypothetical protein